MTGYAVKYMSIRDDAVNIRIKLGFTCLTRRLLYILKRGHSVAPHK